MKSKNTGDTYTANQALEKACELQQNKAANTFLQQTVKYEPIENQVLAMRSQRTEMATTKSNKWRETTEGKCQPNKLNNRTIGENGSAKDAEGNIKRRVNAQQQIKPATSAARTVTLPEHASERVTSTEYRASKPNKRPTWPSTRKTLQHGTKQAK